MLDWWRRTAWYRNHQSNRTENAALASYLRTPLPYRRLPAVQAEYLALDFETTGLDPASDNILSAGYTTIRDGRVILGASGHYMVRVNAPLPAASVAIHQITDDAARRGMPLSEVMKRLLGLMQGRVLLVHHAAIERGFLQAAARRLYGIALPLCMVDTLAIERRLLMRRHQGIGKGQLRLFNLRRQYNLPRYRAHNAMEDALAAAELFLAQMHHRQWDDSRLLLKDLLQPW